MSSLLSKQWAPAFALNYLCSHRENDDQADRVGVCEGLVEGHYQVS